MSDKGVSVLSFAFVVLAVGITLISWLMYNSYFGSSFQQQVFTESKIDTIRNEIEGMKNFIKQSLIFGSHQSLVQHAESAGLVNPQKAAWICGAPDVPTVEQTKSCLESYTKYFVNVYLENYTINLPVSLIKEGFENCSYNVTSGGVLSEKYDEGNFIVAVEGGKIYLSSKNALGTSEIINSQDEITRNRFWYMFRIFKAWAEKNVLGNEICKCTMGCQGCGCVKRASELAYQDLIKRFDKHVICRVSDIQPCCQSETGCGEPKQCLFWDEEEIDPDKRCLLPCEKKCVKPEDFFGSNKSSAKSTSEEHKKFYEEPLYADEDGEEEICTCLVWPEWRLAGSFGYSCTDYKYYVPGPGGPKPLTFSVSGFASFRVPHPNCEVEVECTPGGGGCCTPCVCKEKPPETTTSSTTVPPAPPTTAPPTTAPPPPPPTTPTTSPPAPPTTEEPGA